MLCNNKLKKGVFLPPPPSIPDMVGVVNWIHAQMIQRMENRNHIFSSFTTDLGIFNMIKQHDLANVVPMENWCATLMKGSQPYVQLFELGSTTIVKVKGV